MIISELCEILFGNYDKIKYLCIFINIRNIMDMAKQPHIYTVRGKKVVIDRDLAVVLGVETRVINQNIKRNAALFVDDRVFQLTKEECLTSQILVTLILLGNVFILCTYRCFSCNYIVPLFNSRSKTIRLYSTFKRYSI